MAVFSTIVPVFAQSAAIRRVGAGRASLFGGEGGFGLQAHGQGQVVLSVYGAIDVVDLQPGEKVVIDTGHVVAYDLGMQFRMRRAVEGLRRPEDLAAEAVRRTPDRDQRFLHHVVSRGRVVGQAQSISVQPAAVARVQFAQGGFIAGCDALHQS